MSAPEVDDALQAVNDKKPEASAVSEIAASSIRSGLAELELKTSQVLQRLENVKTVPGSPTKIIAAVAAAASSSSTATLDISNETTTSNGSNNEHQQHDGAGGGIGGGPSAIAADNAAANSNNNNNNSSSSSTSQHSLTQLQAEHRLPADILKLLEQLVAHSENDDDPEFPLPALDDVSHLALISHSIIAYLSHLDHQQLLRVTNNISGDTTRWLSTLFRFNNAASSFHADNADAILRTVRLAIATRCPGYLEGGIPALAHPCFYTSENLTPLRLQYACRQLGISLDAIKVIPSKGTQGAMDLTVLQKQVQNDVAANRTPLLIFADIGASLCGYIDILTRLRDFCKTHNIWLHASGHGLASLACAQSTGSVSQLVHSMSLNLGSWLGVPSLPIVLLHRPLQNAALSAFEMDPILSRRLKSLSLWTTLQALGRKAIAERLYIAFQTCDIVFGITAKCKGLRVLSPAPAAIFSVPLAEAINTKTAFDADVLFDAATPVVAFQFDGTCEPSPIDAAGETYKPLDKLHSSTYFDRLNSWLGQILQRDCPNLNFEVIEHTTRGSCIRYCPLELGLGEQPPSSEHLECFAQSLEAHVDILRATIKHKAKFMQLVEKNDLLRLVHLPEWAGMGGVRFVPEGWESLLTDQAKTELNKLNIDLVEALKSTDNAFSLGESTDGLICVRFGMVTHETEVEELLDLVVTVGKSVQENSRVLDTMSEIVKKGIEAATADLQRETEEKLWQEGILRHVPVVGRVFNWWSPAPKEAGIRGRSLNLTQGVVESTENIYKYHMQMTGAAAHQLPANRSPPTPMVQTPVISTANNSTPPVFPAVESLNTVVPTNEAASTTTTTTTVAAVAAARATVQPVTTTTATAQTISTIAAAAAATATLGHTPSQADHQEQQKQLDAGGGGGGGGGGDVNHARTVSQSSTTSSSAPELVAANNAINGN